METVKARVLSAIEDVGSEILPNSLVHGESSVIESLKIAGLVDTSPAAVSYCEEQGGKPILITGGYLSDKVKERIAEAQKPKPLSKTEKNKAIAALSPAEKIAFEKSGLTIEEWLAKSEDDRQPLIFAEQRALDQVVLDAMSEHEKAAFAKSELSLPDWQALPEDERKKLTDAETPTA